MFKLCMILNFFLSSIASCFQLYLFSILVDLWQVMSSTTNTQELYLNEYIFTSSKYYTTNNARANIYLLLIITLCNFFFGSLFGSYNPNLLMSTAYYRTDLYKRKLEEVCYLHLLDIFFLWYACEASNGRTTYHFLPEVYFT